jgi:hypothetical protein
MTALLSASAVASTGDTIITQAVVPGATLRITIRDSIDNHKVDELVDWLRATAASVSAVSGRFPNPSPHIVVLPIRRQSWGSASPVPFGRVTRNGEERIELYVNLDRPVEDYYGNWTATHEFSHLLLPHIRDGHKWISEGFASYYQNVLMARAGNYSQAEAWRYLYEGLERGRGSRPELSLNDAALAGIGRARMKVYWGGAAIALLADVALRNRSDGAESLDTVLGRLQQCCLPSEASWSGLRLFRKLDSLLEEPIFMDLYQQYAMTPGFPDYQPVFSRLGVKIDDEKVRFEDDADLAMIREAITGVAP